jgi:hypothetical protein
MSDQLPLESDQDGGEGKANARPSPTGDQQASTVDAKALANLLKGELEPWLDETLTRKLQGEKDRRINKVERRLETTEGALARLVELMEGGMNVKQAQQQLRLESALEFIDGLKEAPQGEVLATQKPKGGTSGKVAASDEATQLLKEAGLEEDPEWVERLKKGFASDGEALRDAANLIVRRVVRQQAPNPAAVIQPSGGALPEVDLEKEYRKEMLAAKGKGNNAGAVIRRKYRELGLDVNSVSLT